LLCPSSSDFVVSRKVLELDSKVLEIARELYEKRSLLIMGRGFNFATCLEGALKVKRKGGIGRKL
jgi:glucosamine 6-phosphate synthetase-like amidotransferase/phosphosugar isomerase protein